MNQLLKLLSGLVIASFAFAVVAEGDFGDGDFQDGGEAPVADNTDTAAVENLGPFGGNLWDVAFSPDGSKLYTVAKDSPNGFYWSDDVGANWHGLTGVDYGGGIGVEVSDDTGAIFVTFSQGLYKSTDEGQTFSRILEDNGNAMVFIDGVLLMSSTGDAGTLQLSSDEGESFTAVTVAAGENIWSMAVTAGKMYVQTLDSTSTAKLYTSEDQGTNWTAITIPTLQDSAAGIFICVDPTTSNLGLTAGFSGDDNYISTNSGSSWTATGTNSVSGFCTFDAAGRLYMGEMYSDDLTTWESLGADDSETTALGGHFLIADPNDVNTLYADGMPGLSKTSDRGQTWEDINEGISGVTITDISQANNKDIVWAAAYNGIAKTDNFTSGSPTWTFPVLEDPGAGIWVKPDDSNIVLVGEIGAIRRTADGGATWTENDAAAFLSHDYSVTEFIQDVDDSNTVYAAVVNGEPNNSKTGMVLVSHDLGVTWEDMDLLDGASAQTITQASNGDIYVGVGAEAGSSYKKGIYKYSAGSWEQLAGAPDEEIVKVLVDPDNDEVVYAVASIAYGNNDTGNFGFYKSTNSGSTWTKITEGLGENQEYTSLTIQSSTDPNTLYLGAVNYYNQGVLYKSADGGDTWGVQYTGLQEETFYTLIFDGVTVGSSRGLFDVKSKASLTVKAAKKKVPVLSKAEFTITLKDAATDKKLKKQSVKFFQKKGQQFELVDKVKTDNKGKATISVRLRKAKQYQFKATWKPKASNSDEYASSTSDIVKVTGKK